MDKAKVRQIAKKVFENAYIDDIVNVDELWSLTLVGSVKLDELNKFAKELGIDNIEISAWEEGSIVGLELDWEF